MELARIADGPRFAPEALAAPAPGPAGEQRVEIVHALMRGRYRWGILLAALLALPAAWFGYKSGGPVFRSDVTIRVERTEKRVLYDDEEKGVLPFYDSFVETQMSLITSRRVIELAMQDPVWTQLHNQADSGGILPFLNSVTVDRKSELITVSFDDPQPQVAAAGAEAVVSAYRKLYLEDGVAKQTRRLDVLRQLEMTLSNDLQSKSDLLAALTASYGVHDTQRLTDGKYEELHKLEMKRSDLELQMALIAPINRASDEQSLQGESQGTAEDFAASDPVLASLLQREAVQRQQLEEYQVRGLGPNHPMVQTAKSELAYLQTQVEGRMKQLRNMPQRGSFIASKSGDPTMTSNLAVLNQQIANVRAMQDQADRDYKQLDHVEAQSEDLRSQMSEIKKRLEDTRSRIEQLNVESSMSDRITFPTDGKAEPSLAPFKDTRKKYAAAAGAGAGMLGFGLVFAITLMDRRVRNADEVRVRLNIGHLLGVLPALPANMSDLTGAAAAAHAVHQIRSMLQIRATHPKPCFAITSSLSGSGKTSLSLALAFSFASSGAKTLLIDCDLVGGGLTRRLNATARKRLGRMLRSKGVVSADELRDALRSAKLAGKRIGRVLVERGLASDEEIEECVDSQNRMSLGLLDAVHGESLMNCVTPTGVDRCFILPVGGATAHHAVSLSPAGIRRLIESARRHFDVVVVDSGPMPGSLEAAAVAAGADGVVMVVSCGEPRAVVEDCVSRLRAVGARLAGVVLNRVSHGEMVAYSGSLSRTSRDGSSSNGAPGLRVEESDFAGNVGPLASAVACSTPASNSH